jgi:hypothetical protein
MSVLSTLALLVTTAAVKSRAKADRTAELEAEIVGLKSDLADARRDLDQALSERDALRDELERRLLRHGEHPLQQIPAGPDFRPPMPLGGQQVGQLAQQNVAGPQQAQALLGQIMAQAQCQVAQQAYQNAQYAAMQNVQSYDQGLLQQQGLFGAQALNPEMWCNCVPSRAQVWAARNDGY